MKLRWTKTLSTAALLVLSGSATAQELDASAVEIERDAMDLRAALVPRPDLATTDTALVFTNPGANPSVVVCAGRNANGVGVGRARTRVPARGVRLILASDLSNGRAFVGSATCKARDRVVPSAFIIGGALSDAPARVHRGWDSSEMNFPVIATF